MDIAVISITVGALFFMVGGVLLSRDVHRMRTKVHSLERTLHHLEREKGRLRVDLEMHRYFGQHDSEDSDYQHVPGLSDSLPRLSTAAFPTCSECLMPVFKVADHKACGEKILMRNGEERD